MITYIFGSNVKYSQIPDEFWKELGKLMEDNNEILVGNSDFDHRVYGRCRSKQYENISVMREGPKRKNKPVSLVESLLPSYVSMIRKSDCTIAVWDGDSSEVFVNLLLLLALHKNCRMYYLPSNTVVEIESIDDLAQYVPERQWWTVKDLEEVLKACGFEDQMINHLLEGGPLSELCITEIVCQAPIPLRKKWEIFESLQEKNNIKFELLSQVSELIRNGSDLELIKTAIADAYGLFGRGIASRLSELRNAELMTHYCQYYLFIEWYDTDVFMVKSYPIGFFNSLDKAKEYIRREEEIEKEDWDDEDDLNPGWYRLELWNNSDPNDEIVHEYDFYIYENEICWFEELRPEREKNSLIYYMSGDREFLGGLIDLRLSTPFKIGDIVYVDCRPFGPPFHALIIEDHNQFDCCLPQVFFKMPFTDKWAISALKHKHFYKDCELHRYEPILSPLFRLRKVREDELTKDDELLLTIGKDLKDDETGYAFSRACDAISYEGVTAEEALKALESVKN